VNPIIYIYIYIYIYGTNEFFEEALVDKMMGLQYIETVNYVNADTRAQIRGLQISLTRNTRYTPRMMLILLITDVNQVIKFKWFVEPITEDESQKVMDVE